MRRTRRRQDPERTRVAILEAACTLLAKDGPEGLSVSQVAQLAKVNRGTAYQHFQTREQLLEATTAWVSEKLRRAVFGDAPLSNAVATLGDAQGVAQRMAEFAMENPALGRVWLFELLASSRPASDPFWNQFKTSLERFAASDQAQPGIDVDVHAVIVLIGTLLWPIFVRADSRTAKQRRQLVERFSNEMLRLSLQGTMRPEKFPELDAHLRATRGDRPRRAGTAK
ncbi:TetR/AcrR family transcriptional regulator [Sinimarinibacterium thermocellulolyticum]|uniref:TetR/AcrR family transcriptional regulator n=1 Tax=Sinimarinibacterium thermocellulolyticum TaxID=3170016 RepID=A0ABV2AC58_9GAMM